MRIAVIADIHGNLPALEAVLADIKGRDVDHTINLGDCVSGPLWPREVCDLLRARDDLTIRGNHDRWVSGPDPARMGASDRYAFSRLNQDHRSWLGALNPQSMQIMASSPVTARRPTTTSISSRKSLGGDWYGQIRRRSECD
jgi:predicted phosphodiesterase